MFYWLWFPFFPFCLFPCYYCLVHKCVIDFGMLVTRVYLVYIITVCPFLANLKDRSQFFKSVSNHYSGSHVNIEICFACRNHSLMFIQAKRSLPELPLEGIWLKIHSPCSMRKKTQSLTEVNIKASAIRVYQIKRLSSKVTILLGQNFLLFKTPSPQLFAQN